MSFFKRLGGKSKKEGKGDKGDGGSDSDVRSSPKDPERKGKLEVSKSHYHMHTRKTSAINDSGEQHPAVVSRTIEDWNSQFPSFDSLAAFKDVPASQRPDLFIQKLLACQRMFVWQDVGEGDDDPQWAEKEQKRKTLVELVDFINATQKVFTEDNMGPVVQFAAVNMFRGMVANPLPPHVEYDPEEDEPMLEPAWGHLQLVMEFFLRFVVSPDVEPKTAKKWIDQAFITKLLLLFDSEDARERDFLKTILHRIYGKFMVHRAFIRKAINNVFYHFVYNAGRHNGIAELLEILGSIINGFATPLKDEHKVFMRQALIPLHKAKYVSQYHGQLTYCMRQFVEKDPRLIPVVIKGILRFWPVCNGTKEVLFLTEIEEILEVADDQDLEDILLPLFRRINLCIMSMQFQVAEKSLYMFHQDYMLPMVSKFRRRILPIIFPGLMANTKAHWNTTVHQLTLLVVKGFSDMDPQTFEECTRKYKATVESNNRRRSQLVADWQAVEAAALAAPHSENWVPPKVYTSSLAITQEAYEVDTNKLKALALNLPIKGNINGKLRMPS